VTPTEPGLGELCRLVEAQLGILISSPERPDNRMRLERALKEAGCADWHSFLASLNEQASDGPAWTAAIRHLTIGETYFFRHKPHFDLLRREILPALVEERSRLARPYLRLWSAGCASGEEAYSLAMLVREVIPDLERWSAFILATDVNHAALAAARAGRYSLWSFRDCEPSLQSRYFLEANGRFAVKSEIARMVAFMPLNLIEASFPNAATSGMDVVLCRNVTMYFAPEMAKQVANRVYECLTPGGWLFVGPSEPSTHVFERFEAVMRPQTPAYRRPASRAVAPSPIAADDGPSASHLQVAADECLAAARESADRGRHADARDWCCRALDADPANADAYYLLGMTHTEDGNAELAAEALRKAVYLDPSFVLAYLALANELEKVGDHAGAERAATNARRLLAAHPGDASLRGGDITAAELRQIVERGKRAAAGGRAA
jgi:chemotaxis protein methyltransferase CheR